MSAVNRKKSSEGDKKQSRRQIEKLLDSFLKVKLDDGHNPLPSTRYSVNAPVGTRSNGTKLTSSSLPSVYPPGTSSASLSEVNGNNNNNRNFGSNNTTARERSDSASKRKGKLTLNWKKVKRPISGLFSRSDSKSDQSQVSVNGKASLNSNEISYNWRSGDRSNFYLRGISDGDDDVPETTERAFAEEARKSGSNGATVVPAKLNVSRLSLLTALSKDSNGSSDVESPTDAKPGTEEDLRMWVVAQHLAALAERKDLKLSDMQLGNCSYTTKKKTYKRFEKMANEALRKTSNTEPVASSHSIEITSPQDEGMAQIATILNLSTSIISTWGNIGDLAEKVKKHTAKFLHNTFAEWIIMQGGWGSFDRMADE